jgi:hypothetical protein
MSRLQFAAHARCSTIGGDAVKERSLPFGDEAGISMPCRQPGDTSARPKENVSGHGVSYRCVASRFAVARSGC